jgi:hypothetical protein
MAHGVSVELEDVVTSLRNRVSELEEQLQGLRQRIAVLERTVSSVVELDDDAFRQAARQAYERLSEGSRGFVGVIAIADLRRALGPRISRDAFDAQLVRLHDGGAVQLMAPPSNVSDERRKEGLVHPTQGTFYYLRWERRS